MESGFDSNHAVIHRKAPQISAAVYASAYVRHNGLTCTYPYPGAKGCSPQDDFATKVFNDVSNLYNWAHGAHGPGYVPYLQCYACDAQKARSAAAFKFGAQLLWNLTVGPFVGCAHGNLDDCGAAAVTVLGFAIGTGELGAALKAGDEALAVAADEEANGVRGLRAACANSFAASTGVQMADGTTKPIDHVKIGDKVTATDPTTGKTSARTVTALHLNQDTQLTDLSLQDANGHTTIVHTTQHHPFYDNTLHKWVDATQLRTGDQLLSLTGQTVTVTSVRSFTDLRPMYNLTIDTDHTYYVIAGTTPVLVHNQGPCNSGNFPADSFENTEYSMDELSGMAYRHTGSGDTHIGGSAPRPTELEIRTTLSQGTASPYGGNSVEYVNNGIRVIINRDMPWQSTAYYIGK
jgi:hypothetical protein